MNNSGYKGLANDEYNLYETIDNGKTWNIVGSTPANATFCYDRIIYGSTEDLGLRYSDDGGTTLVASDHPTGNWDGITYVDKVVYAHSMDGLGIFTSTSTESNGIGEVWTKVADADSDAEVIVSGNDNEVYYQCPATNMLVPANGDLPIANATILNGEIVSNDITLYDGELLTILNRLILPQLVSRLTGSSSTKTLNYFTEGITYSGSFYDTLFTGLGLNVKGSGDAHFSETDFQNLLGMMPLKINISDYTEQLDTSTVSLVEEANLPDNETLTKTLQLIDNILEIKRTYAEQKIGEDISNTSMDMSNLADLDLTAEDYANAVYNQKMFYDVQKASTISILVSMIRAVYMMDTDRKISLLKAAIYETVNSCAGNINYQLNKISSKLKTTDYKITDSDLVIDYDFSAGLRTAIEKYYNTVFNNIVYSINNNSDLKNHAAIWYRENFRSTVLQSLGAYIRNCAITYSTAMFDDIMNQYDSLVKSIAESKANKEKFIKDITNLLNSKTDNETIDVEELINQLDSKYYTDGINALSGLTTKKEILETLNELPEYNNDSIKELISYDDVKTYMNDIYNKIKKKMKSFLEEIRYEDYYSQDDDYGELSNEEVRLLEEYCKEIIIKFKGRCLELLEVIYSSMLANLDGDGYEYYVEYICSEIDLGNNLTEILSSMGESIKLLIEKTWYNMKERV